MSTSAFLPIAYALVCERRWTQTSPAAPRSSTDNVTLMTIKTDERIIVIYYWAQTGLKNPQVVSVRLKWNNRGWLLWRRWKHRSEPQTAFKWPLFVNAMTLVLQEGTEYSCLMRRVAAQRSQDCYCLWLCVHLFHVLFSHMELMVNTSSDTSLWCVCWDQSVAVAVFIMRPLNLLITSSPGNGFSHITCPKTTSWWFIGVLHYKCTNTHL